VSSFDKDFGWQNDLIDEVIAILSANAGCLVKINRASIEDDMKHGKDVVIHIESGDIGVRLRRGNCRYRDFTLRWQRDSGAETEASKMAKGCTRWYLYAWTKDNRIAEWWLIDVDRMRHLITEPQFKVTSNWDGTYFKAFPRSALDEVNAVIAESTEPTLSPPVKSSSAGPRSSAPTNRGEGSPFDTWRRSP
jgi:hypothetical protein